MSVSVIMTCFNEGAFIGASVRSVLDQTRADTVSEIFIADDGSTEDTLTVLREIESWDKRVKIRLGAGNGLARNRNRVAAEASGEFLAFLDGDDIWSLEKLAVQLPLFEQPEIGLAYTGFYLFPDGHIDRAHPARLRRLPQGRHAATGYFLNDPPIIPSTMMIRNSVFQALDGFDETIPVFEDTDFYLRAAPLTGFAVIDSPLLYKRNHSRSLTADPAKLMMHHASVAFRFASAYPDALPLVPRRLAARAAKLGNVCYYAGDLAMARRFYRLAVSLDVGRPSLWFLLAVARIGGTPLRRWLAPLIGTRAEVFGRPT